MKYPMISNEKPPITTTNGWRLRGTISDVFCMVCFCLLNGFHAPSHDTKIFQVRRKTMNENMILGYFGTFLSLESRSRHDGAEVLGVATNTHEGGLASGAWCIQESIAGTPLAQFHRISFTAQKWSETLQARFNLEISLGTLKSLNKVSLGKIQVPKSQFQFHPGALYLQLARFLQSHLWRDSATVAARMFFVAPWQRRELRSCCWKRTSATADLGTVLREKARTKKDQQKYNIQYIVDIEYWINIVFCPYKIQWTPISVQ